MTSLNLGSDYIRDVRLGMTQAAAIYVGAKKIWPPMAPVATQYATVGAFTYTIPADCDKIDVILLGGGGGGGNGSLFLPGTGGAGGQWLVTTLVRGVDIPWTTTSLTGNVGAGGAGGAAAGGANNGIAGDATTIAALSLSAAGGAGGAGWGNGQRNGFTSIPNSQSLSGQLYSAGLGGTGIGVAPGSGGASVQGTPFGNNPGFAGARGQAWFYAYSSSPTPLPPTLPGGSLSVIYDAVGTGGLGTGSGSSYTATGSHVCSGNAVVVAVSVLMLAGSITGVTATYGGQAMTQLGTTTGSGGAGYKAYLFGLLNPPTGSQTVSSTATGSGLYGLAMSSVSYSGVTSFGTATTNAGSSNATTQTISSSAGKMVAHAFASFVSATISGYNQTQRLAVGTTAVNVVQGDAAGAASVTFNATINNAAPWTSIAVELNN